MRPALCRDVTAPSPARRPSTSQSGSNMSEPAILLIGGLDPQGCAGSAADLATIRHHGRHGLPLVTAVTTQSSGGLTAMGAQRPDALLAQHESCVADFSIGAIK